MPRIEISVAPEYVNWGLWEAVREIAQNAKDAADIGYPMQFDYSDKQQMLEIKTRGTTLPRSSLRLGGTSKRDDPRQRGKFGEGYKLACAALTAKGIPVTIWTGQETWTPSIQHSKQFDSEVLVFDISTRAKAVDGITFRVFGLDAEVWEIIQDRLLFFRKPIGDVIEVDGGRILLDEHYRGKLYTRGIFVCPMEEKTAYGYDIDQIELDRDRRMVDMFKLTNRIGELIRRAVTAKKLIPQDVLKLLDATTVEARGFMHDYDYHTVENQQAYAALAESFAEQHGENTIVVSNMAESLEAQRIGVKAVLVSEAFKTAIARSGKTLEVVRAQTKGEIAARYGAADLTAEELASLDWTCGQLARALVDCTDVLARTQVVDFVDDRCMGLAKGVDIFIARRYLLDRRELLIILIHELGHTESGAADETRGHRDACDLMWARIVMSYDRQLAN